MNELKGYKHTETLHEGQHTIVSRMRDVASDTSVIVKFFKEEYPSNRQLAKVQLEYEIARQLDLDGIVRPVKIVNHNNGLVLILEDFGAQALHKAIPAGNIEIQQFLEIAIKISTILGEIHGKDVIHKDIKPHNIIINMATGAVKITDFGISTLLSRETQKVTSPGKLEGTIAYIAPEQTGRMNRSIDYRTDYYSLGITLYELITGKLPFEHKDPMELVHSHIAIAPQDPVLLKPEIPEMISRIIMKLLAKNAEDRYQSSYGISHDLKECLKQWTAAQKINEFKPAKMDLSGKFHIPQKLYGRERETEQLLQAFQRVSRGGSELLFVAGYSGIGKSALINEVQKPIVAARGYFISGKYDQFRRDIPNSAIIQAFQDLIRQILGESDEEIKQWKETILGVLGANGQVIVDVIPEVEHILGQQAPVIELGPAESQTRFNLLFQKFLQCFADKDHPLVVFLDDLQWADAASLNLIEVLMNNPDANYLLLMGAYRDNEVSPEHPLMYMIDALRKVEVEPGILTLSSLGKATIKEMISETLGAAESNCMELSDIVFQKTNGNPFFTNEFLRTLYKQGILNFNVAQGKWEWDSGKIDSLAISDNVVELMSAKILELAKESQEILKIASCIGNNFDLRVLSIVSENPVGYILRALQGPLKEGLLIPIDEDYKYIGVGENGDNNLNTNFDVKIKFLHDRVQQAANSLLSEQEKAQYHYSIGKHLLDGVDEQELSTIIIDVVNHLNIGHAYIESERLKLRLADLNVDAGNKALKSNAYKTAVVYFGKSLEIYPEDTIWSAHYDYALSANQGLAIAEFLSGNHEPIEGIAAGIIKNAKTPMELVKTYESLIQFRFNNGNIPGALDAGLDMLDRLGIKLPRNPGQLDIMSKLVKLKLILRGKSFKELEAIPRTKDPKIEAAVKIMVMSSPAAFYCKPNLLPIFIMESVIVSILKGTSTYSPQHISNMSILLCGVLGDIAGGKEWPDVAENIRTNIHATEMEGRVGACNNIFGYHWKQHVRTTIQPLLDYGQKALEFGDRDFYALCRGFSVGRRLFVGDNLDNLEADYERIMNQITQVKVNAARESMLLYGQVQQNLMGKTEDPVILIGERFNGDEMLAEMMKTSNFNGISCYYLLQSFLFILFGRYEEAYVKLTDAQPYLGGVVGMYADTKQHLYKALAQLGMLRSGQGKKRKLIKGAKKHLKYLKKLQIHAPMNRDHEVALIEAEIARAEDREEDAEMYYDIAISKAHENLFTHEEALANELAGQFYLEQGKEKIARLYLTDAHYNYKRWGATAKVKDLKSKYGQYIQQTGSKSQSPGLMSTSMATVSGTLASTTNGATMGVGMGNLDISSVVKSTQAISGEIKLESLLGKLMHVVIENAGADRAVLVLNRNGELFIEAERTLNEEEVILNTVPLKETNNLPTSIINFVERTKEAVVLEFASDSGAYSNDAYIRENKSKSVLCSPIINQGQLVGLLYLENNLSAGAFTESRLQILNMISSQAAISIENAMLYNNMESKVEERTKEVADILTNVEQGIFTINRDHYLTGGYSGMVPEIFTGIDFIRAQAIKVDELVQSPKLDEYLDLLFTSPFINQKLIENANPLREYDYTFSGAEGTPVRKKLSFSFSRIFEPDAGGKESKGPRTVQKLMVVVNDKTQEFEAKQELEQKASEQAGKVEQLYQILQLQPSVFSNFISESGVTLEQVKTNLKTLGDDTEKNKELLRVVFREVHTLKGNARALNLESIAKSAHGLEDVFEELKEKPQDITEQLKERTFRVVKTLKDEIQDGNALFKKILNMQSALQTETQGGMDNADAMSPMEEFEQRFQKIVEMESKETGKPVEFKFLNQLEEPLNEDIINKLRSPLSHIVRNSISHGIEPANERKHENKSEKGSVTLRLTRVNNTLTIICEDDGGGLNTEKIREKARRLKLFSDEELDNMSRNDVNKLIFSSGLSTKDQVSEGAGRGVGMDAVREELKALKAVIGISTKPGKGTRFTIRIPGT